MATNFGEKAQTHLGSTICVELLFIYFSPMNHNGDSVGGVAVGCSCDFFVNWSNSCFKHSKLHSHPTGETLLRFTSTASGVC